MRLTQKINAFRHTSLVQSERLRGELPDLSVVVYGFIQKGGGVRCEKMDIRRRANQLEGAARGQWTS